MENKPVVGVNIEANGKKLNSSYCNYYSFNKLENLNKKTLSLEVNLGEQNLFEIKKGRNLSKGNSQKDLEYLKISINDLKIFCDNPTINYKSNDISLLVNKVNTESIKILKNGNFNTDLKDIFDRLEKIRISYFGGNNLIKEAENMESSRLDNILKFTKLKTNCKMLTKENNLLLDDNKKKEKRCKMFQKYIQFMKKMRNSQETQN